MGFRDEFAVITQARQPLAPMTHLRIGGPAEYLVVPRTREELARVVAACAAEKIPLRVLGVGTNILVRDEGVSGVVVRLTAPDFTNVTVAGKNVKAGGGATLFSLISAASLAGLAGFEALVGITATVGGALKFNAGDRSGEIADHLTRVEVIDAGGRIVVRERDDIHFGEHDSDLDDPDAIVKRMRRAWINRKAEQPFSHQSAVRVFRNPHGQSAAHLLERAGLVRARVGAAEVSDRNANYIIAQPGTRAADVIALAEKMRLAVKSALGVTLEQELKVW
jgi:UDP-N-acetylmuramate dehydrogenase